MNSMRDVVKSFVEAGQVTNQRFEPAKVPARHLLPGDLFVTIPRPEGVGSTDIMVCVETGTFGCYYDVVGGDTNRRRDIPNDTEVIPYRMGSYSSMTSEEWSEVVQRRIGTDAGWVYEDE